MLILLPQICRRTVTFKIVFHTFYYDVLKEIMIVVVLKYFIDLE